MRSFVLVSAALSIVVISANSAFATIITFTGGSLSAGNSLGAGTPYVESGYTFSVSGGSANVNAASLQFADDFLVFTEPASITLTGTGLGLSAFNLNFFNFGGTLAGNFTVTGNKTGGGAFAPLVLSADTTFKSASAIGWTDLSSVVFSTTSLGTGLKLGLDNVTVEAFTPAAVPEPATASILGLGTMIGAFCQYRRRKRAAAT
jgi:hypothetical protein